MVNENGTYEFTVISAFGKNIKSPNGEDQFKIIKPQAEYRVKCLIVDVLSVSEAFTRNGDIAKNRCYILHKEYKELLVKGNYNRICDVVFPNGENNTIGYGRSK